MMRLARASLLVVACTAALGAQAAPSGGNGTIYVGTYAKDILVVDEATLAVRDTIKVKVGIPYRMLLSYNRTRFYIVDPTMEQVEVIDIAGKKSLGSFSLSNDTTKVRIWGINVDPLERFAVLLVKNYTKKKDRYEISRPILLRYDLERKAIRDTIPWPAGEERDGAQIIFSPNGQYMYFSTSTDILVYDAQTLKQVDRWDLSRTLTEEGMGRIGFGFPDDIYEEPGFYTGLFRVTDPVNRRQLMGVARMDLANRNVDFYSLGPSQPVSFQLAPGKTRAYGMRQEVGNYQFWTYDLENRRVLGKVEFKGRPRMGMRVSSNGRLLYIGIAGATIDVYDTQSFQLARTVTFGADMTTFILIPPRGVTPGR